MTISFKFPASPVHGDTFKNEVTGTTYRFLGDKNSWIIAGSDATYDDSELREEIERLEEWLKSHLEDFIRITATGILTVRSQLVGDPYTWGADSSKLTPAYHVSLGRTDGSTSWIGLKDWDQVDTIDISRKTLVLPDGTKSVDWGDIITPDEGDTFYLTPVDDEGRELGNYAQLKAVSFEGGPLNNTYRFKVKHLHSAGEIPAAASEANWNVRVMKTLEENPAVIVRRQPVNPDNYTEGTLWFDLDSFQMNVNVFSQKAGKHVWMIANVPPDVNGDFLWNKPKPGNSTGTPQTVNTVMDFEQQVQFRKKLKRYRTGNPNSLIEYEALYSTGNGRESLRDSIGKNVLWTKRGTGPDGNWVTYESIDTNSKEHRVSSLRAPRHLDDAARYQDTFDEWVFQGFYKENGPALSPVLKPGHFMIEYEGNSKSNFGKLIVHRVDKWMRPIAPPMNQSTARHKIYNTRDDVIILRHKPVNGTSEVETVSFCGHAHTLVYDSTHFNSEGLQTVSIDKVQYKANAGNFLCEFAGGAEGNYVVSYTESDFKVGETYTIRIGAMAS